VLAHIVPGMVLSDVVPWHRLRFVSHYVRAKPRHLY
jgi:hypothetical protein